MRSPILFWIPDQAYSRKPSCQRGIEDSDRLAWFVFLFEAPRGEKSLAGDQTIILAPLVKSSPDCNLPGSARLQMP